MVDLIDQKSVAMQGLSYLAGSPGFAVPHLHGNASNLECGGLMSERPAACVPSGPGATKPSHCSMQSHPSASHRQAFDPVGQGYCYNYIPAQSLSHHEGCPANSPPAGPK